MDGSHPHAVPGRDLTECEAAVPVTTHRAQPGCGGRVVFPAMLCAGAHGEVGGSIVVPATVEVVCMLPGAQPAAQLCFQHNAVLGAPAPIHLDEQVAPAVAVRGPRGARRAPSARLPSQPREARHSFLGTCEAPGHGSASSPGGMQAQRLHLLQGREDRARGRSGAGPAAEAVARPARHEGLAAVRAGLHPFHVAQTIRRLQGPVALTASEGPCCVTLLPKEQCDRQGALTGTPGPTRLNGG